jgi:hypothetical protein
LPHTPHPLLRDFKTFLLLAVLLSTICDGLLIVMHSSPDPLLFAMVAVA